MTHLAVLVISGLNVLANTLARFLLWPISMVPGWVSNTVLAALSGVFLLTVFKYISNQAAIGRLRSAISAQLLAIRLFKDNIAVPFKAQFEITRCALLLLVYAIPPVLVMLMPVSLLIAQMGLWYQHQPLAVGEPALVRVTLKPDEALEMSKIMLEPGQGFGIDAGPVRVADQAQVYWRIIALADGYHTLTFRIKGQQVEKALAIGSNRLMRVSQLRPGCDWGEILLHPAERPLCDAPGVAAIDIQYPDRDSWAAGTNTWVIFFFGVSLIFALLLKPILKVKL